MYFQLSNKRVEWNKRAGWAESFIYDLKKLEQVWQIFRLFGLVWIGQKLKN